MPSIVILVSAETVEKLSQITNKGSYLEEIYDQAISSIESSNFPFEANEKEVLENCPELTEEEGIKVDVYAVSNGVTYPDLQEFCNTMSNLN